MDSLHRALRRIYEGDGALGPVEKFPGSRPLLKCMARNSRLIEPGLSYHVTQRGTNRENVFFTIQDRETYLVRLRANLGDAGVRVLAFCLMTNHVHLVLVPERADSLAVLFRRAHGQYAQYLNARRGRSGHLWQNRFFSCPLAGAHLWRAIRYVEANPVRAGLVRRPEEYRWSSAAVHLTGVADGSGVLDLGFWERAGGAETWRELHAAPEEPAEVNLLRRCTYSGRPYGGEEFVAEMEEKFQRKWRRWSFEKGLSGAVLA